jgi:hypothetical protein
MMPYKMLSQVDTTASSGGENPLFAGFYQFFGGPRRASFVAVCCRIPLTSSPKLLQDGNVKDCQVFLL